jgi:proteasome lid subunit RPN8/RPN11
MIPFEQKILEKIKEYCLENQHQESCGFIYNQENKNKIFKCKNISHDPKKFFLINPEDYEKCSYKGKIECCFHSHIRKGSFSNEDIINSFENNMSNLLYDIKENKFYYFDINNNKFIKKYLGLEFEYGIKDCWSLVLDFYKNELSIDIQDPAPDRPIKNKIPENPINILDYLDWFKSINFEVIKSFNDIKIFDILVFDGQGEGIPTHFGIFLPNNMILHHIYLKKSIIESMRKSHFKFLKFIFRHKKCLDIYQKKD